MRKTLGTTQKRERGGLRIVAAIALTGSLAAFGCSTNKVAGNSEPAMSPPATSGSTPQAMISSSPSPANGFSASEDAIAAAKADEGFKGKYLGEAAPADGTTTTSSSLQQVTGQFIPPSATANPQVTVNSSISSGPNSAIVSGADGGGGLTVATGATVAAPAATTAGVTNTTSAVSNTTATPITNTTSAITTNTTATASSTQATPVAGSTSSVRVVNTNGAAVVTNAPPTAFQRFMTAIGLRQATATTTPTTTTATPTTATTTTPAATTNH